MAVDHQPPLGIPFNLLGKLANLVDPPLDLIHRNVDRPCNPVVGPFLIAPAIQQYDAPCPGLAVHRLLHASGRHFVLGPKVPAYRKAR